MDWYLQSNFPAILHILAQIKEAGNLFFRKVAKKRCFTVCRLFTCPF
jgi:hypothetical protein